MDMSQYRELFLSESRENLQALNTLIIEIEENPSDSEKMNALFRAAHSLKGMAASMGYDRITEISHKMEDLMHRIRDGLIPFEPAIAGLLLEGAETISLMLNDIEADKTSTVDFSDLAKRITEYSPDAAPAKPDSSDPATALQLQFPATKAPIKKESFHTIRVRTEILDHLIEATGELFTTKQRFLDISRESRVPRLDDAVADLSRLLRELHQMVMQVRLMPFASLADRFPKVVRDLSKSSGKELTFEITGKEIELDRGILEELSEPLNHILRNAVDHGVELPAARVAAGKPATARVLLSANREKDQVAIVVADDGKGMDPAALISSAVKKGVISAEEGARLSPEEAFLLTCVPGFSTAAEITDISGRGVGMDAVRSTVQALGGHLAIKSAKGNGTKITIRLPLSIAIINVLTVKSGGMLMAIPVTSVFRTVELRPDEFFFWEHKPYLNLDDQEIPIYFLNELLGIKSSPPSSFMQSVIISSINGRLSGIAIDRVLNQQEVHIKPLGSPLSRLHGLAGSALLGDGNIIFVLDPATLPV